VQPHIVTARFGLALLHLRLLTCVATHCRNLCRLPLPAIVMPYLVPHTYATLRGFLPVVVDYYAHAYRWFPPTVGMITRLLPRLRITTLYSPYGLLFIIYVEFYWVILPVGWCDALRLLFPIPLYWCTVLVQLLLRCCSILNLLLLPYCYVTLLFQLFCSRCYWLFPCCSVIRYLHLIVVAGTRCYVYCCYYAAVYLAFTIPVVAYVVDCYTIYSQIPHLRYVGYRLRLIPHWLYIPVIAVVVPHVDSGLRLRTLLYLYSRLPGFCWFLTFPTLHRWLRAHAVLRLTRSFPFAFCVPQFTVIVVRLLTLPVRRLRPQRPFTDIYGLCTADWLLPALPTRSRRSRCGLLHSGFTLVPPSLLPFYFTRVVRSVIAFRLRGYVYMTAIWFTLRILLVVAFGLRCLRSRYTARFTITQLRMTLRL